MPIYQNINGIRKKAKLAIMNNTFIPEIYYGDKLVYQSDGTVFESDEPGEYTIKIPAPAIYNITLVGGGGGGAHARYNYTHSNHSGGSGSMVSGNIEVQSGTYTIVVGGGGDNDFIADSSSNAYGQDGGDSSFFGQVAGGGKGAWAGANYTTARGDNGNGGVATGLSSLTLTNGIKGDTTGIYIDGIGAGGGSDSKGNDGYVKISFVSFN